MPKSEKQKNIRFLEWFYIVAKFQVNCMKTKTDEQVSVFDVTYAHRG